MWPSSNICTDTQSNIKTPKLPHFQTPALGLPPRQPETFLRERHRLSMCRESMCMSLVRMWVRTLVPIRPSSLLRLCVQRHLPPHRGSETHSRHCAGACRPQGWFSSRRMFSFSSSTFCTRTLHFHAVEVVCLWAALDPFPAGRRGDNL